MADSALDAETLLVVDDDAAVRKLIVAILRNQGYQVLEAADGQDALVVAGEHAAPIHLIVSDVKMPRMGGWKLLERLREWYPSIRFLLVSGYTQSAASLDHITDTPTAFLPKPFTPEQLSGSVRALLDRPRAKGNPRS